MLVKCWECEGKISSGAAICPHCGYEYGPNFMHLDKTREEYRAYLAELRRKEAEEAKLEAERQAEREATQEMWSRALAVLALIGVLAVPILLGVAIYWLNVALGTGAFRRGFF